MIISSNNPPMIFWNILELWPNINGLLLQMILSLIPRGRSSHCLISDAEKIRVATWSPHLSPEHTSCEMVEDLLCALWSFHDSQWFSRLLKGWIPFKRVKKKRTEQDTVINNVCPAVPRFTAKQSKTFTWYYLVVSINPCWIAAERSFSSSKWVSNGGSWYVNNIE